MRFQILVGILGVFAVAGCNQHSGVAGETPDQANLCEVKEWAHDAVSESCTPGQKVIFLPSRWGNEQLPVIFAAVNCDLRYAVALTSGAVTCIYGPITPKPGASAESTEKPDAPDEP